MTILSYNRLIKDLNGRDAAGLIAELKPRFSVEPSTAPVEPAKRRGIRHVPRRRAGIA